MSNTANEVGGTWDRINNSLCSERVANKKANVLIGQRKEDIATTDKSLATIHERLTDISSQVSAISVVD